MKNSYRILCTLDDFFHDLLMKKIPRNDKILLESKLLLSDRPNFDNLGKLVFFFVL